MSPTYPLTRKRRLRYSAAMRSLVAENSLSANDLILPVFVLEGKNHKQAIKSMPGVYRLSQDLLIDKLNHLFTLGLKAIAIFPVVDTNKKSELAEEAYNDDGLVQRTIRAIKLLLPEILIISDVALDPYTIHGQDGLVDDAGYVLNDPTIEILRKQAVSHAIAGVDIVAPSDMMDGRIVQIRMALEENDFANTNILAYSAKYASCFYGPFRDAVGSAGNLGKSSKESYQMNPANSKEAIDEIAMDIDEGADMVMVKPGMPYLDIIAKASEKFNTPIFAYQVSGEYAMLQAAIDNGSLDEKKVIMESLLCFKRAGCAAILSYYTDRVLEYLHE
ncbi:MAG: porphobilinogen synthase [Proteobacteria bacterium]|nr:porphobilinogen synthase [Pseudomonadota bacterium]